MGKKSFFAGILCLTLVFGFSIAGCDIAGLINNAANGGGSFDSALVGTWYYSQAAADNGGAGVFTFASDGRLTGSIVPAGVIVDAATSNRRISATIATVDAGSADYNVSNGALTFTNAASGTAGSYFSTLTGSYYKPAGSSGNGGNGSGSGADDSGKNGGNGENGGNGSSGGDSKGDNNDKADDPAQGVPGGTDSANPFLGAWWWADDSYYYLYLVIEDYTWELAGFVKGTYTYSGTEARFTVTHQWVGKGGEDQKGDPGGAGDITLAWSVDDEYWEKIEGEVFTARVSGDRLVITSNGSTEVFTRDSGGGYPDGGDMPVDPAPVMPAEPPSVDESVPQVPGW